VFIINDVRTLYVFTRYATVCAFSIPWSFQFGGNFAIVVVVDIKSQPNLVHELSWPNETFDEPLGSLGALSSRKPWKSIGWTMGPKKACPKTFFFATNTWVHLSFMAFNLVLKCGVLWF
jgi:hypothetical protein